MPPPSAEDFNMTYDLPYKKIPTGHNFIGFDFSNELWFLAGARFPKAAEIYSAYTVVGCFNSLGRSRIRLQRKRYYNLDEFYVDDGYDPLPFELGNEVFQAALENKQQTVTIPFLFFQTIVKP